MAPAGMPQQREEPITGTALPTAPCGKTCNNTLFTTHLALSLLYTYTTNYYRPVNNLLSILRWSKYKHTET